MWHNYTVKGVVMVVMYMWVLFYVTICLTISNPPNKYLLPEQVITDWLTYCIDHHNNSSVELKLKKNNNYIFCI